MSVNKLVKGSNFTVNQNYIWHGVRSIKKAMKTISPEKKTWFQQLSDKEEQNRLQLNFTGQEETVTVTTVLLKSRLSNIPSH